MIRFNALEKIIDRLTFRINNHNKSIKNKSSHNYGTQIVAERVINKTELPNKSLNDIRKLNIIKSGSNEYKVEAIYSDGTKDDQFNGYWYGWQLIQGKPPVWTPLGKKNSIDLGQSQFSEISVWVREQEDERNVDRNVHSSISAKDEK